jgi:hypothetical protein
MLSHNLNVDQWRPEWGFAHFANMANLWKVARAFLLIS